MWSKIRRLGLPAVAVALLAFAGGCQSESDRAGRGAGDGTSVNDAASQGGQTVQVELTRDAIQMPNTLRAGPTTFVVKNSGEVVHSFQIEGEGIDGGIGAPLAPGETRQMVVDLKPGSYRIWCPVDEHGDKGMEIPLQVTE